MSMTIEQLGDEYAESAKNTRKTILRLQSRRRQMKKNGLSGTGEYAVLSKNIQTFYDMYCEAKNIAHGLKNYYNNSTDYKWKAWWKQ